MIISVVEEGSRGGSGRLCSADISEARKATEWVELVKPVGKHPEYQVTKNGVEISFRQHINRDLHGRQHVTVTLTREDVLRLFSLCFGDTSISDIVKHLALHQMHQAVQSLPAGVISLDQRRGQATE